MAEDLGDESGSAEPSNKKKMIVVGSVSVAVVVLCVVLFIIFAAEDEVVAPVTAEKSAPVMEVSDPDGVLTGAIMQLNPIVVNLRDNSGYIKFQADIEYFDFALPFDESLHRARAHDILIKVLSSKTPDELLSAESKIALRAEMIESLNTEEYYRGSGVEYVEIEDDPIAEDLSDSAYDSEVVDIFFREFIIQ
jgi:flagellar basal body-associated protein FliL